MSAPQAAGAAQPSRLTLAVRALRHRNYKLFFFGQGTSLIGTWMQMIALSWVVYVMTGSTFLVGVVNFCGRIPTFALAPLAGVVADRADRRTLLIATQSLAMMQAFALALLTYTGNVHVWHLVVLSSMLGLVNAFDIPIRQSFVVEMVGSSKEDLPNAIALNSFLVNGAQLVGPALAGAALAAVGAPLCFVLNGISFIAVIGALLAMRITPGPVRHRGGVIANFKEGFTYAFGYMPIRSVLLLVGAVSLVALSYPLMMPALAKNVFHGGPRTYGFLMAASGVGAISGAIFLAVRPTVIGLERVIAAGSGVFGLMLVAFAFTRTLWAAAAVLVVTGTGRMIQIAASNTLLQTIVDDDKRGRVMSFYTMSFMGMGTFGSLLLGYLAERFGEPHALIIGGVASLAATCAFALGLPRMKTMIAAVHEKRAAVAV
jgi:MFS family permease